MLVLLDLFDLGEQSLNDQGVDADAPASGRAVQRHARIAFAPDSSDGLRHLALVCCLLDDLGDLTLGDPPDGAAVPTGDLTPASQALAPGEVDALRNLAGSRLRQVRAARRSGAGAEERYAVRHSQNAIPVELSGASPRTQQSIGPRSAKDSGGPV